MYVYINRPVPKFSIHHKSDCCQIKKNKKEKQKFIEISNQNFKERLTELQNDPHPFSESVPPNDMWLNVNVSSPQQNEAFVNNVRKILGIKYHRLSDAPIKVHHCKEK